MNNLTQYPGNKDASWAEESLAILQSLPHRTPQPLVIPEVPCQQSLTIYPTHPNLLKNSLSWFDSLDLTAFPPRFILECKTMLGEAVDNVRDHAHEHLPIDSPVPIIITQFTAMLCLQVWDQGPGFDLKAHLAAKQHWPDSGATRGRGIKIVAELSNYVDYLCQHPLGNCLTLIKIDLDSPDKHWGEP
jgi:serine/threonine-protein kinase RsbW